MMTDKKDLRKNLNICLLLTLLLCVLAVVPLFAPQADWRLNAAIFGGQVVLVLPLLYYAKVVLRRACDVTCIRICPAFQPDGLLQLIVRIALAWSLGHGLLSFEWEEYLL